MKSYEQCLFNLLIYYCSCSLVGINELAKVTKLKKIGKRWII